MKRPSFTFALAICLVTFYASIGRPALTCSDLFNLETSVSQAAPKAKTSSPVSGWFSRLFQAKIDITKKLDQSAETIRGLADGRGDLSAIRTELLELKDASEKSPLDEIHISKLHDILASLAVTFALQTKQNRSTLESKAMARDIVQTFLDLKFSDPASAAELRVLVQSSLMTDYSTFFGVVYFKQVSPWTEMSPETPYAVRSTMTIAYQPALAIFNVIHILRFWPEFVTPQELAEMIPKISWISESEAQAGKKPPSKNQYKKMLLQALTDAHVELGVDATELIAVIQSEI